MTPREVREQQKHFKALCQQVILFLARMDVAMTKPSTFNRGTTISDLCNALEFENDAALRFGLNLERKGTKLRRVRRSAR